VIIFISHPFAPLATAQPLAVRAFALAGVESLAGGRRIQDSAAAADVTDRSADQDRASRRSAGD
jgi:hypothetical protein